MDSLKQAKASFEAFTLDFKRPSGTSRGILTQKKSWKLQLTSPDGTAGIGECSVIPGLSPDYISDDLYEQKLKEVCQNPFLFATNHALLIDYPSILFGLESAYFDLLNGGKRIYFESAKRAEGFSIPINGLIWMGDPHYMQDQIEESGKAVAYHHAALTIAGLLEDHDLLTAPKRA